MNNTRKQQLIVLNYNNYKNHKQFIQRPTEIKQGYLVLIIEITTSRAELEDIKTQIIKKIKNRGLTKEFNLENINNMIDNKDIKIEFFIEKELNKARLINNENQNSLLTFQNFEVCDPKMKKLINEIRKILKEVLQQYDIEIMYN